MEEHQWELLILFKCLSKLHLQVVFLHRDLLLIFFFLFSLSFSFFICFSLCLFYQCINFLHSSSIFVSLFFNMFYTRILFYRFKVQLCFASSLVLLNLLIFINTFPVPLSSPFILLQWSNWWHLFLAISNVWDLVLVFFIATSKSTIFCTFVCYFNSVAVC